jgi:predicted transcriptional regulator
MSTQSTTVSVRLPKTVEDDLIKLAAHTQRSKSFLAGKAISAYVASELEIIEGLERAEADIQAGRVVSHEEAMKRLYKTARGG